ncbi:hypothetical protein DFQ27_000947 [Actinomortierella ambigua]|uniref:TFIIB-type domain-containing protein n=1 Tax=Actinomortierella ambigua TaxID=1343610 RepID=A0A9P6QFN1_9FUNG|nr:hypothetical protein DFQ27_000947 [Actinomortierella ambigua]
MLNSTSNHPGEDLFALVCPDCSIGRMIPSDEVGYICSECGFVLEETLLAIEDRPPNSLLFALPDMAAEETTILTQFSKGRYVACDKVLQSMQRYRRRFMAIKSLLENVARTMGMTMGSDGDTERAFFMFKQVKELTGWRFGRACDTLAIACLFLASKERNRGFSLVEVATRANQEPSKVGHIYKKAVKTLLDEGLITLDHPCFKKETDPWFMLDRLIFLGHKNDSRGVDLTRLPPDYQTVLGVGMDDIEKIKRLRHIMTLAAKCLALTLETAQGDSQTPESTVAACVATAVQIEAKASKVDDRFWCAVVDFYYANLRTAQKRRAELKNALQHIASQNPILAGIAHRLKQSDFFACFAEEALKFWEPSCEQLREQIRSFQQRPATGAIDESDVSEDEEDRPTGISPVEASGTEPTLGSVQARHLQYPPSFVRAQQDRAARARQLQEAQQQLQSADKGGSSVAATQHARLPTNKGQLSAVRLGWMKHLLAVEFKTPVELKDAPDSMLEYWVEQSTRSPADREKRSEEELNSRDPTARDMCDDEIMRYLRPPVEVEEARTVLQPIYDEYEAEAEQRSKAIKRTVRKRAAPVALADAGRVKRRNPGPVKETSKASSSSQDLAASASAPPRPRSSLINWEAVQSLEREEAEAGAAVCSQGTTAS